MLSRGAEKKTGKSTRSRRRISGNKRETRPSRSRHPAIPQSSVASETKKKRRSGANCSKHRLFRITTPVVNTVAFMMTDMSSVALRFTHAYTSPDLLRFLLHIAGAKITYMRVIMADFVSKRFSGTPRDSIFICLREVVVMRGKGDDVQA